MHKHTQIHRICIRVCVCTNQMEIKSETKMGGEGSGQVAREGSGWSATANENMILITGWDAAHDWWTCG